VGDSQKLTQTLSAQRARQATIRLRGTLSFQGIIPPRPLTDVKTGILAVFYERAFQDEVPLGLPRVVLRVGA